MYKEKYETEEEKLAAVKENPYDIQYIHHPSEAVQLTAVNVDPGCIYWIPDPTPKVQLKAIMGGASDDWNYTDSEAVIVCIENPTENAKMLSFKLDKTSIPFIPNPSEKLQMEYVKYATSAIQFIKHPTKKVIEYVIRNSDDIDDIHRMNFNYDDLSDELKLILNTKF